MLLKTFHGSIVEAHTLNRQAHRQSSGKRCGVGNILRKLRQLTKACQMAFAKSIKSSGMDG